MKLRLVYLMLGTTACLLLALPLAWLICFFLPTLSQRLPLFRRICSAPAFFLYLAAALLWGIARNL